MRGRPRQSLGLCTLILAVFFLVRGRLTWRARGQPQSPHHTQIMPSLAALTALCLATNHLATTSTAAALFRPPGAPLVPSVASDSAPACADTRPACSEWASEGECVLNPCV